jgi:hypothetical protein
MIEAITEWFEDIDWNVAGIALALWGLCLLMIWKFFDQNILKLHLRIIMTVIMLPAIYLIVYLMSDK